MGPEVGRSYVGRSSVVNIHTSYIDDMTWYDDDDDDDDDDDKLLFRYVRNVAREE